MTNHSTQDRVIKDYFRTTSAVGSASSQAAFDVSVVGLRRRIGSWLDVEGKDVLDLGSGIGDLCRLAQEQGAASITGVNLSADEVDYARGRTTASFVCQDIASYLEQCPAASIDTIFALNILEHLDKDYLARVLEGALRVLRSGGQLIAMVPNASSPFGCMNRYWDITHFSAFTPSSVMQLTRLTGFDENVEFRECGPIAHGLVSGIRFLLWQCIRLCLRGYLMIETASAKGGIYTGDMMFRLSKSSD